MNTIYDYILRGVAVILAITLHEMAHGYTSYWLGDDTAKSLGRLSLNPLKHVDWIGAFCLLVFGFGWAKPVPIDYSRYKNGKTGIFMVAVAGPLTNIILAIVACGLLIAAPVGVLQDFLYMFIMVNIGLGAFNLIPIPPLDGSKMLAVLLPANTYQKIMQYERYGFVVLLILLNTGILDPVYSAIAQGILALINIIY